MTIIKKGSIFLRVVTVSCHLKVKDKIEEVMNKMRLKAVDLH
ncbi:MAG: hypothetical protein ACI32Y_03275 [Clostridium sp.]